MTQKNTALIHHPYEAPGGFEAPPVGVFKASTVFFPSVAAMRSRQWKDKTAYTYGLHGTPTTYTLEERLCTLEGGLQCVLTPSGLSAISLVALALLRSGDEVLLPDNCYEPNKTLIQGEFEGWGVRHRFYDPLDLQDLESKLSPATRLVWLEAPGSVTLEFPDLPAMVRLCKAHGALVALDNTWGAGLAFAPFDLTLGAPCAVDVSIQALTKYPSGGGDVLMGSVITRNLDLHMRLKLCHMRMGLNVGANDAEAILRSLPSIHIRYQAQDHSTRELAHWCQSQTAFAQVLHPALPDSPGHGHWKSLCARDGEGAAACLFSVVIDARYSQQQVDAFCDNLRLFRLGYSWAGPISLVVPYTLDRMRGVWPSAIAPGTLVRFAVGLEAVDDLKADIAQAIGFLGHP